MLAMWLMSLQVIQNILLTIWTKRQKELTTIINKPSTSVESSLKQDIIPNINACGFAWYVLNRLQIAEKSGSAGDLSSALISPSSKKTMKNKIFSYNKNFIYLPTCLIDTPVPINGVMFIRKEGFETQDLLGKYEVKIVQNWRKEKYIHAISTVYLLL